MIKQYFKLLGAVTLALALFTGMPAGSTGTPKGISSEIQAYYDCNLLNILFVEFTDSAAAALLQHNKSINNIWFQDPRVSDQHPVIDAIPADAFNPVWQEKVIMFKPGNTPRVLCRDDDVNDALTNGEITTPGTGDVYWCPVIGRP
jgi:hypothetical protein